MNIYFNSISSFFQKSTKVFPEDAGRFVDGPFPPYTRLTYAIELNNELYDDGRVLSAYSQGQTGIAGKIHLM